MNENMNPPPPPAMAKIVEQTQLSCPSKATSLGEGEKVRSNEYLQLRPEFWDAGQIFQVHQ